jgi:hypothetical protein
VRWSFLTRCDIDRARGQAVLKGAEGALAILYSLQDVGNVDVSVHAAHVSTDYLCRAPASELRFTTSESASACAEFLLIPSMGAVIPGHTTSVAGKGRRQIDFRLENRGFTLSIGSGEFEMDGLRSDAEVLLRTSTGSDSFGCVVLNASFLASRTRTIFKAPCRIRYADVLLLNDGASVEVSKEDLNSLQTGKPDLVVPVRNAAAR